MTFEGLGICLSPAPLPTLSRPLFIFSKLFHRRHSDQAPAAAGHLFYSLFVFPHPAKLLPTCPNYAFCFFQLFLPIILLKSKRNIRQPRPKPNSQFEAKTINSQTRKNTADIKIVMYHNFTILSETCQNLFIILIVFPFHDFNNFSVSAQQRIQEGKEVRLKHLLPVLPEADPGVQGGLRHHRQRQGWHHHCPRPKKGL